MRILPPAARVIGLAAVLCLMLGVTASIARGQSGPAIRTTCDPDEEPLFICETNRQDKYVALCAVEEEVGRRWSAVQYRFGVEHRAEFVYPADPKQGASRLFFSHVSKGSIYEVSVRFRSGGFTYRILSSGDSASDPIGDGSAGVTVTDAAGKTVADIKCIERPTMFAPYMQMALACDLENPHGKAACGARPYEAAPAKRIRRKTP